MKFRSLCFILAMILLIGIMPTGYAMGDTPSLPDESYDGYLVKIRDDVPVVFSQELTQNLEPVTENLYITEDADYAESLADEAYVEYIEPNYKVYLSATVNDPHFDKQWGLSRIGVPSAWNAGYYGKGVRVAVIDSGINRYHEDFANSHIDTGLNLRDGSTDVTDTTGHGTAVSGIIAASRDNGIGIAGIADEATIVPLKCFTGREASVSYIISAIYQAVDNFQCDVINLSLGLDKHVESFRAAIQYAQSKNAIIIASAGNSGTETVLYPAAYDGVIGVGAVDRNNQLCSFSQRNYSVFVTAPGEGLLTLGHNGTNEYVYQSGTSFSAPFVTAVVAMARSYNPYISGDTVIDLLKKTATDLGPSGYDTDYGHGMLHAGKFMEQLLKTPRYNTAPVATEKSQHMTVSMEYNAGAASVSYTLDDWFYDAQGDALKYAVHATSADGKVSIKDSTLTYTPSKKDMDKTVRIVVSAHDGELLSTVHAVLNIKIDSHDIDLASVSQFSDLSTHWSKKYVAFCVDRSVFEGVSERTFAPNQNMSRGMFITALARLSGDNIVNYTTNFHDVSPEEWYYRSVGWAQKRGLINGTGDMFYPNDNITREQLTAILSRYAKSYGLSTDKVRENILYGYTDTNMISGYAVENMQWAASYGLLTGKTATVLDPKGLATRGEVSAILTRFIRSFY